MLTFKERRKRVDSKQIISDMDNLEKAFLLKSEKLNEKRSAQLKKRMAKLAPELEKNFEAGKLEGVERTLETLQIPSSKEWGKLIYNLVYSSARAGVLRAHLETLRLKELYEFAENELGIDIKEGKTTFDVNFPPEAEAYLKKYGYEIGVITEDTVRQRIRDVTLEGLHEGIRGRDLTKKIDEVTDTWVSQTHADTIARTETAKMYNAGRVSRWLDPAQNGFVEALQYDSIVDTRTTELCRDLDGKIISVDNASAIAEFTPPNHFRCRATWIPVTRYEEWEDNFPADAEAQKGFDFKSPLPALIRGGTAKVAKVVAPAPLVTPVVTVPANTITDPLVIRNLDDEDFREAIFNIKDMDMKYFLIKERAEQMLASKGIIREVAPDPRVFINRFDDGVHLNVFGDLYIIPAHKQKHKEFYKLLNELEKHPNDSVKYKELLLAFTDKNGGNPAYLGINEKLLETLRGNDKAVEFKGFTKKVPTQYAKDKYTFITPKKFPASYYKDPVLDKNRQEAQQWLMEHMHENVAPHKGIEFVYNGRIKRAYAHGYTINLGTLTKTEVMIHEAGHVIHNNSHIGDLVDNFFRRRTNDLKMKASRLYGEKVIEDSFYHAYIGRIYGWEAKNRYGQEVLSMGIQAMYEDPAKFYREDKEHFLFTYAIMEGLV